MNKKILWFLFIIFCFFEFIDAQHIYKIEYITTAILLMIFGIEFYEKKMAKK